MIFTIIIPVYNIENYIKTCIESVLIQSYRNIEIILVNDGSSDKSGEICDNYAEKDNRIKVIHKPNGGLSAARNTGIKAAKGDYILFLDGDDYWEGDVLNTLNEFIGKNSTPDIIFGNFIYNVFPKGKVINESCGFKACKLNKLSGESALKYIFTETELNPWSAWRNIYNTNFLKENNLFFKDGILCEDAEWTPRVILKSKSIVLYEHPFYMYRQGRAGSIMNTCSKKKILDYLDVVIGWLEYSNTIKDKELSMIIKNKYCNNYVYYFTYLYFFDKEFVSEIIDKIEKNSILNYITDPYCVNIKNKIKKRGYESVLRELNYKYIAREKIKSLAIRLNLIDR